MGGGQEVPADAPSGRLTLRWREARTARGALRLAQRVREDVSMADLRSILEGVARLAYADEFLVVWPDGASSFVHRNVLAAWAASERRDLPSIPEPEWKADLDEAAERAEAIDGMRRALARLLASGVVDGDWASDLVRRVHVAAQSLPASSVGPWRA